MLNCVLPSNGIWFNGEIVGSPRFRTSANFFYAWNWNREVLDNGRERATEHLFEELKLYLKYLRTQNDRRIRAMNWARYGHENTMKSILENWVLICDMICEQIPSSTLPIPQVERHTEVMKLYFVWNMRNFSSSIVGLEKVEHQSDEVSLENRTDRLSTH